MRELSCPKGVDCGKGVDAHGGGGSGGGWDMDSGKGKGMFGDYGGYGGALDMNISSGGWRIDSGKGKGMGGGKGMDGYWVGGHVGGWHMDSGKGKGVECERHLELPPPPDQPLGLDGARKKLEQLKEKELVASREALLLYASQNESRLASWKFSLRRGC